jgi:hypothetical protein
MDMLWRDKLELIPLDRIVGSVGRYDDFDNRFRFKQNILFLKRLWIKHGSDSI